MPGWYIHMNAARKAIQSLSTNGGALPIFGSGGPDAGTIAGIATRNPAYVALGAIGPDIFFLLPDFKPPVGTLLWGAANTILDLYSWWDENFLGPYQDQIGPIHDNLSDEVDAVTGGLASTISKISSEAFNFLLDAVVVMISRTYDVFSFLGSGVPSGYDEQVFFWSDMLHYRKTYEFAARLWKKASDEKNETHQAFALGWMSHLATDVAGHCFVNEKAGGPYRVHWQRHHLVENHMDANVYDSERGTLSRYQMLSDAALHLWVAFNNDASSRVDFFKSQPGPDYDVGDRTPDILSRKRAWDWDSKIPDDLAAFLAQALRDVYNPAGTFSASATGQCADHPTIISALVPGHDGYPNKDDIALTYSLMYKYMKFTTTDYYQILRPEQPKVFNIPPFPSPPGSGEADPGPGPSDDSAWHDFLEILLAIFAWIVYLFEVAVWPVAALIALIASAPTYPIRELLYENVELPLYNAFAALHWYLAMAGFVYPMQQEINMGLTTLGVAVPDVWKNLQSALADPFGGLIPAAAGVEPSGSDRDSLFPHDVVVDPQSFIENLIHQGLNNICGAAEAPGEFIRPWLWPEKDNEGDNVPSELPLCAASPYKALQDATALFAGIPGSKTARDDLEGSGSESETIGHVHNHLTKGETLGDPVDYTGYVIAKLTRDNPDRPGSQDQFANFNLDADRGYGYLCWDWVRSASILGNPKAFGKDSAIEPGKDPKDPRNATRSYNAPLRPGFGWCDQELTGPLPPPGDPGRPKMHDPQPLATGPGGGKSDPVKIRYIDREVKFQ
jgi:hypothetical protein